MKSKKVLIFINSLTSGGAEKVSVSLSSYLARKDYAVIVVTMHGKERDFFTLDNSVGRISLRMAGEHRGFDRIIANIRRLKVLRSIIKREQPDIIIGMMTAWAIRCILACMGLPVKVVVSERNFPGQKQIAHRWNIMRKIFYPFASAHVAQTQETSQWIIRHARARNVEVIPNSVAWPLCPNKPVLKPQDLFNKNINLMLAVGSLSKQKGFDLLIEAFAGISSKHPEWKLVILGEQSGKEQGNNSRKTLERLVKDRGLEEQVHMPGRIGNVGDWYQRADMFILSSRYEGFPNVLLEAMAAGCPCIAFDCETGPRDIIENGINGILVSPEDTLELGRAMSQLMEDSELRKMLSKQAITVRDRFSEDKILGQWKNLLDRLVEEK